MQCIGRGSFSTVYKKDSKTVFIRSIDPVKECMAWGWFPSSRLFPKVSFAGNAIGEYVMRYYPKVSSLKGALKPTEYQKYRDLRKVMSDYTPPKRDYDRHAALCKSFGRMDNKRLGKIMQGACDAVANYGPDVCFEISPRNVAVTEKGYLVLLDCFFVKSVLMQGVFSK